MSAKPDSPWVLSTVSAVREVMIQRLERRSLDPDTHRELQMALEELDVMWEELQGQAEILLREHQRYAEFFEFAPDAYLITDAGGSIREANRAAKELLHAENLAGQPLLQFVGAGDVAVRAIALQKSGAAGRCWLIRPA